MADRHGPAKRGKGLDVLVSFLSTWTPLRHLYPGTPSPRRAPANYIRLRIKFLSSKGHSYTRTLRTLSVTGLAKLGKFHLNRCTWFSKFLFETESLIR